MYFQTNQHTTMNSHAPHFVSQMEQMHLKQQIKVKEGVIRISKQALTNPGITQSAFQFQCECAVYNRISSELSKLKVELQMINNSIKINNIKFAHTAYRSNALETIEEMKCNDIIGNEEDDAYAYSDITPVDGGSITNLFHLKFPQFSTSNTSMGTVERKDNNTCFMNESWGNGDDCKDEHAFNDDALSMPSIKIPVYTTQTPNSSSSLLMTPTDSNDNTDCFSQCLMAIDASDATIAQTLRMHANRTVISKNEYSLKSTLPMVSDNNDSSNIQMNNALNTTDSIHVFTNDLSNEKIMTVCTSNWKSETHSILENMIMIGRGMATYDRQTFTNAILSVIRTNSMNKQEIANLLDFVIDHGMSNTIFHSLCKNYVTLCFDVIQCIPPLSVHKSFAKWIPLHKRQYILGWFINVFWDCLFRTFDIFRSNMIGANNDSDNNDESAKLQYTVVAIAEYYQLIDIEFGNQIFDHILDVFLSENGITIPNEKEIECLYELLKRCGAKLQKLNGKRMDNYCSNLREIADCQQYKMAFMKAYHTMCYVLKLKQNEWNSGF